ncbi:MAG: hypothetical protein RLZZ500_422 [Bacteroidota bacterium]
MKRMNFKGIMVLAIGVVSLFTNCEHKKETTKESKEITAKESERQRKKWEASEDGKRYIAWENSPEGKKVHASHDLIRKELNHFQPLDAIVTSLTYMRPNTKGDSPKWLLVRIAKETYMLQFNARDFKKLKSLKVGDSITIKSRYGSYSNNHPYLILSSDYIAHHEKVLFQSKPPKNKC